MKAPRLSNKKYRDQSIQVTSDGERYDPSNPAHQGKTLRTIKLSSFQATQRDKQRVEVVVINGITAKYDPSNPAHAGLKTKNITKGALRRSNNFKTVIKGTYELYDPKNQAHQERETEVINTGKKYARKNNRQEVTILKGTTIEYDEKNKEHQGKELITTTRCALRAKRKRAEKKASHTSLLFSQPVNNFQAFPVADSGNVVPPANLPT